MDITTLCQALATCLSPVDEERKAAEYALQQQATAPGQLVNLLRVAAEQQVDFAVRQQAAIYFKNVIKRNWHPIDGKLSSLDPNEKQLVKENFLEALIRARHEVQVQLVEALREVIHKDFPREWPGLMEGVYAYLTSPDPARVHGGLLAMRALCRKYEYTSSSYEDIQKPEDKEDAEVRNKLAEVALPVLLQLFQAAIADTSGNAYSAEVWLHTAKCLLYLTFIDIPPALAQPQAFASWMKALHDSLVRPIPVAPGTTDPELLRKLPWWRARKASMRIVLRLFSRFSNAKDPVTSDADKAFGEMYRSQCMMQFLEDQMKMLVGVSQGQMLPEPVLSLLLQYLTRAISVGACYKVLKPHLNHVLLNTIFPMLCHSDEDDEMWNEDPQEFIRRGYDMVEEAYNVKSAAANLVTEIVRLRTKEHLQPFMMAMAGLLNELTTARTAGGVSQALARRVDGALLAIGYINLALKKKEQYRAQLEPMLLNCVLPCLELPIGHLRAKAAWLLGQYSDVEFHNPNEDTEDEEAKGPAYYTIFNALVAALSDRELPVRVDAAVSLGNYIDDMPAADPALLRVLSQLLTHVVQLMAEIDNEGLLLTLENIVETAGDDIAPYALDLTRNLVAAFTMYSAKDDADDDDFAAAMAASGCLNTINTLLAALQDLPHMFAPMEALLFPLIHHEMRTFGSGIEEVLKTVLYITYLTPEISPRMWTLWPLMHQLIVDNSVQYWSDVIGPMDNFIGRGTEYFLTCRDPDYLGSVYQMVNYTLTLDCEEEAQISALQLLSVVLQNAKGRVDACLGPYLALAMGVLQKAKTRDLQEEALLVIGNGLYYNASMALAALVAAGQASRIFSNWYSMIFAQRSASNPKPKHFRTLQHKKICVLGLCSVLAVPDAALPAELRAGLAQITGGVLKLLLLSKEQEEKEALEAEGGGADGDEDLMDAPDDGPGDEEDTEDDPDYLKNLAEAAKAFKRRAEQGEEEEEDDDDSDDEFAQWMTYGREVETQTPLDDIDVFEFFAGALTHVRSTDAGRYAQLMSSADAGTRAAIEGMMAYAEQRKRDADAAAAREAEEAAKQAK